MLGGLRAVLGFEGVMQRAWALALKMPLNLHIPEALSLKDTPQKIPKP